MKSARTEKLKAAAFLVVLLTSTTIVGTDSVFAQTETRRTRIGDLTYEAGFPTADTVSKLYDELDFQRAVLAFQYAEPLVAFNEMNIGLHPLGRTGDLFVVQRFLDPHGIALTANTTTIYGMSFLDLSQNGPMVVEVTPGTYGALFDLWQQTIAGIGPIGADKGRGGKFLILPMDYKGIVPPGYFPVRSRTTLAGFFARGIVRNNDIAAAAKSVEVARIYPLAKKDNPPPTGIRLITGKDWNSIAPQGFRYWERVAEVINYVRADDEDGVFLLSLLKPLGIERGKPFRPDERLKKILTDAAEVAWAINQTISMAPRFKDVVYYPGTQWEFVLMLDPQLRKDYWRNLEERINYYFQATMASPAMKEKTIGAGSQYLRSARDNKGDWLNGSNQYRLHVPANMPAKEFWSVTVYDYETRSMVQTDTNIAAKSSYDKLITNADGSVDLYFAPAAPAGKESNWIKTSPGRGWWVWFRFYAPTQPFFDKTWRLADFELLK
jgi:hypothetical protein